MELSEKELQKFKINIKCPTCGKILDDSLEDLFLLYYEYELGTKKMEYCCYHGKDPEESQDYTILFELEEKQELYKLEF